MFYLFRPNVCIEREEIDESKRNNSTTNSNSTQTPITTTTGLPGASSEIKDELVTEDSDEDVVGVRESRQFSAHVRMSSCNDEGLSYICETK